MDRLAEAIRPPPSAVGIAPLGALYWDEEEIPTGTIVVIDTFGYTYVTLFVRVNKPAKITLAEVSHDGVRWRRVEEIVKAFDRADQAFVNFNEVIETKEVMMYRYLKVRMDAVAPVIITLEIASKLIDMGALQEIRDILMVDEEKIRERIEIITETFKIEEKVIRERIEIIRELGILEVNWDPILPTLEEIHKILTNPESWEHDHKNVTTSGTPVQLPALPVPDGFTLVIYAKTTNLGNIYIGNSKDLVLNAAKRVTLEAKDTAELRVKKASEVWIDADNADEGVVFWCEKRE